MDVFSVGTVRYFIKFSIFFTKEVYDSAYGELPAPEKSNYTFKGWYIEDGIETYRKELPELTLGMYIDISMFMRVGQGDWNAVTKTDEPIDVVIGVPEQLQSESREYYIIRAHDGEYTFMSDVDDEPYTITISTDRYSSYAIAYRQTDGTERDHKCGLCHICPTFLGICYFIWLVVIVAVIIVAVIVMLRRKKET